MKKRQETTDPMIDQEQNQKNPVEETEQDVHSGEHSLPDAESEEVNTIAKLEVELSAINDKYIRLYSDFENYKKRSLRERIELSRTAGIEIILSLLPVLDDFERAIKSFEQSNDIEASKGVRLIYSKLFSNLESKGLKAMESIGKEFNPDLHDAISSTPPPSNDLSGKVLDEVEKGYFLNDKVIRHAKVIVGS